MDGKGVERRCEFLFFRQAGARGIMRFINAFATLSSCEEFKRVFYTECFFSVGIGAGSRIES